MTTVLIADDQALVRVGLRKILENEPQITVAGEAGDALLAPAVTRAVIEEFTRIPARAQPAIPRAVGELTAREREVLDLLIRGLSNPEICRELVISEATAKTHVAKILQKLGLRDRVQAVIYAYETGLVSPGPAP
jgi:DNA-binding NarL/FixJ family response regulator